jgi:hypothetical protein
MKKKLTIPFVLLVFIMLNYQSFEAQKNLDDLDQQLVLSNANNSTIITSRGGAYPASYSVRSFAPSSIFFLPSNGLTKPNFAVTTVYQGFTMAKRLASNSKNLPPFDFEDVLAKENSTYRFNDGFECDQGPNEQHIIKSLGILEQFGASTLTTGSNCIVDPTESTVNKLKSYKALSSAINGENEINFVKALYDIKKALNDRSAVVVVMNIIDVCYWYRYISEYMCFIGCEYGEHDFDYPLVKDKAVYLPNPKIKDFNGYKHAFTVVGYDDIKLGGALELQNSWGTDFGDQGFIWIKYEDIFSKNASPLFYELVAE